MTHDGWMTGDISTASFFLDTGAVAAPVMDPVPGTYVGPQTVALSSATLGATIHYTTDGARSVAESTR